MDLDARRLTVLAAVARTGTVVAAARALHLTPSAVSQQVAKLEAEAGTDLVIRGSRGLTLTRAGSALARRGERIATELTAAQHDLTVLTGRVTGRVTVVAYATTIAALVGPAAALARARLPAVDLRVLEVAEDDAARRLRNGDVDIVMIEQDAAGRPRRTPATLRDVHLLDDPYVVISAVEGPGPRTVDELAATGWIVGPPGSTTRSVLDRLASSGGWSPTIAHEAVEYSALLALAAAGLGCALIPRLALTHLARHLDEELKVTQMPDLGGRRLFARHRSGRREPAPAVSAVIELLVQVAEGTAGR